LLLGGEKQTPPLPWANDGLCHGSLSSFARLVNQAEPLHVHLRMRSDTLQATLTKPSLPSHSPVKYHAHQAGTRQLSLAFKYPRSRPVLCSVLVLHLQSRMRRIDRTRVQVRPQPQYSEADFDTGRSRPRRCNQSTLLRKKRPKQASPKQLNLL
jgi:hypothetical protein